MNPFRPRVRRQPSSRRPPRPLLALAGAVLAAYGFAKLRRDPRFFANKVVVVSGGSRGLGLAMARLLFAEGATVVLLARDPAELDRAAADLAAGPGTGSVCTHVCDLARDESITAAVGEVAARYNRIDALFNVAGTISVAPLAHLRLDCGAGSGRRGKAAWQRKPLDGNDACLEDAAHRPRRHAQQRRRLNPSNIGCVCRRQD